MWGQNQPYYRHAMLTVFFCGVSDTVTLRFGIQKLLRAELRAESKEYVVVIILMIEKKILHSHYDSVNNNLILHETFVFTCPSNFLFHTLNLYPEG